MPCHSDYDDRDPIAERMSAVAEAATRPLVRELDLTTRLLCGFMRWAENQEDLGSLAELYNDPEVQDWWERHKALDAREGRT